MNAVRGLFFPGLVVVVTALIGVWLSAESRAQTATPAATIAGAWTLNADLSDKPQSEAPSGEGDTGGRRNQGGGGMGRAEGGGAINPEDAQRLRDARRDILNAPSHLTVVQTESQMILITTGDGRVTRLSPDGKKIKDDSTKIERKTKWDGGKLVSEISGAGPGKITETYEIDPEQHQLIVTVAMESKQPKPVTQRRVYDADAR